MLFYTASGAEAERTIMKKTHAFIAAAFIAITVLAGGSAKTDGEITGTADSIAERTAASKITDGGFPDPSYPEPDTEKTDATEPEASADPVETDDTPQSIPEKKATLLQNSRDDQDNDDSSAPRRQTTKETENTGGKKDEQSGNNTSPSPHVHDWIPVTETVHHDAEYRTVHHDAVTEEVKVTDSQAWTEYIYKDWCVCNECGYMTESYDDLDRHFWDAHDYECSGYHADTILEKTIEHPEEFHYETRTVSEAYDEQVIEKQAYDETVITGYKCATCGERK